MKLERVLEQLNSLEKNGFLKVVNDIISSNPDNIQEIEALISLETHKGLKDLDSLMISKVFALIEKEYRDYVLTEFRSTSSQLDILIDILTRDGNCVLRLDWFSRLYETELDTLKKQIKNLEVGFEGEDLRMRDYRIYKSCIKTAYTNDEENNLEPKITSDEQAILQTLASNLQLSQEEIKLINYTILPIEKHPIEEVVNELKNLGIIFFSKKQNTVYVADEVVRILRKIRGKEVADKFFRRVLRQIREPQINLACRKHNIDWKMPFDDKVKAIIIEGISFSDILSEDIYKDGTSLTEKKKFINDLCDNKLGITPTIGGVLLEDKIANLVAYFEAVEQDEKIGISAEGFERLLIDISTSIPKVNGLVKEEFQLQGENVLDKDFLMDFNIKPRDILELVPALQLKEFCENQGIKTRGNLVENVLESYKDTESLYLENYESIAYRDLSKLKENGLTLKEVDLGLKFEALTKTIFSELGFNVDESLRSEINTKKDKIDVLLNLGDNNLILVECKTSKETGYNKFSSVSRQLRSYLALANSKGFNVIKSLLISPEFTDEFVNECELEYELNLSLIQASSLLNILEGFKESRHKSFPYKLLMRDVLIQEDRILKALKK